MFPKDQFIANMGIESFIGAPIYNSNEEPMGMLVLMDDKQMQEKSNSRYILSVFASRAGAELERMNNEELLRKQTKELIKVNAMKDKFLKITAHDLKNPFNSIMGFSELLRRKIENTSKDKIQKMVNVIDDSVKKTCSILDNLSDWSKTQRDVISFNPEIVDIAQISEDIINYFDNYARSKEIKIYNKIKKNTYVFADEYMVKAIFRNLISNSIKYTNKKGKVIIEASIDDENVKIDISDTGIGIDDSEIKKINMTSDFNIRPGTENENGSGLGLIICKDFVLRNNGRLSIDSVVDKGTTVHFDLPQFKE
jgi:signal transduction histidine kinase